MKGGVAAIQVWTMFTNRLRPDDTDRFLGPLEPEQKAIARAFEKANDRRDYIAAQFLARWALADASDSDPASLNIRYEAGGKPYALRDGRRFGFHFNLSRARDLVAVAVTGCCPVGIDAEPADRRVDLSVADRYFCPEEAAAIERQPAARRREEFLRLWTLKEAFVKATGVGLLADLQTFAVESRPARLLLKPAYHGDPGPWAVRQRLVGGRHIVAICWPVQPGGRARVSWRRASAERLLS